MPGLLCLQVKNFQEPEDGKEAEKDTVTTPAAAAAAAVAAVPAPVVPVPAPVTTRPLEKPEDEKYTVSSGVDGCSLAWQCANHYWLIFTMPPSAVCVSRKLQQECARCPKQVLQLSVLSVCPLMFTVPGMLVTGTCT